MAVVRSVKGLAFTENRCEVSPEVGGEERPQQLVKANQTSALYSPRDLANLIFLTGLLGDWRISHGFYLILEDILSTGAKSIPYGWERDPDPQSPEARVYGSGNFSDRTE